MDSIRSGNVYLNDLSTGGGRLRRGDGGLKMVFLCVNVVSCFDGSQDDIEINLEKEASCLAGSGALLSRRRVCRKA